MKTKLYSAAFAIALAGVGTTNIICFETIQCV